MKKLKYIIIFCLMISFTGTLDTEAASGSSIKDAAIKYIGTPYKSSGNSPGGFDCSGFVRQVYADKNITIPRNTSGQFQTGTTVSKSNLQIGDLVFFNTSGKGVSHVGIYIGANQFIHSATSQGVMISSLSDPYYWGNKYIGAKRILPTDDSKVIAASTEVNATRGEVAVLIANTLNLNSSLTTPAFNDVPENSSYYNAIQAVAEAGVFTGDSNGDFNPSNSLTRAELAKVLVNSFDLQEGTGTYSFTDVSSSYWAAPFIQILAQHDITRGMGDGTYGIGNHLTKTQLKLFIGRVAN